MKNNVITLQIKVDKKDYKTLLNAFKSRTKPAALIEMFGNNVSPYLDYFIKNMIIKQREEEEREKVLLNKKGSNDIEPKETTDQLSAEELEELRHLLGGN